jgi:hypothetical protein
MGDTPTGRTAMAFDKQRFQALVLYIAHRQRDDEKFGRTKLAKALFYSDFDVYKSIGKPLTGAVYIRMPFGPFPRDLEDAETALAGEGYVFADYLKDEYEEKRLIPQRPLPAEVERQFEPWQLATVDIWIDRIASATASYISDLSHEHPGWLLAEENGVEIPYATALLPFERPSTDQVDRAKQVARERGWLTPDGEWVWERELA